MELADCRRRHWLGVAREIERGRTGDDLFELRYADWTRRSGVDIRL